MCCEVLRWLCRDNRISNQLVVILSFNILFMADFIDVIILDDLLGLKASVYRNIWCITIQTK